MLLDTSGLLCLHHAAEARHGEARTLFDAAWEKVTHSYVLSELVALGTVRGLPRAPLLAFVADLQDSTEVEMVWVGESLHRAALTLLEQREDKTWSLCDGVSFILMEERGITAALTTDRHFAQAGFHPLLQL